MPVLVFDVNETLLDLAALDPAFERAFGDSGARQAWFQQLLASWLVATLTDAYQDFASLAAAALEMTAGSRGVKLADRGKREILQGIKELPPHPDVIRALERLRAARVRMATLTNSPPATVEAQLQHAGIRDYFEQALSVDATRRYKPAPEPYRMAAERLGVQAGEVLLVAAHAWDVAGAMRAGCRAAFIARPGKVLSPLQEHPQIIGPDLEAVATQVLSKL